MKEISTEQYGKIISTLELKNIFLSKLSSDGNYKAISENMQVKISDDAFFEYGNNIFTITTNYILQAKNQSDEIALEIKCTFILQYNSPQPITADFFDIYKKTSLPFNVWPYFREQVNNITSRMNIPPLTLPLIKNII
jgi:preprotein translocase subunit SecB